ncbi:hypothetical protein CUMW_264170 [Citrus unshiu]|uniref:Uncharacterized protein n=1 Tax=Citrus unshiu TaxID=55188 RepID=A0A2H5QUZ4_CITUN|nr:hypothetical protein CUMW_264170 [Citrus unshiu]
MGRGWGFHLIPVPSPHTLSEWGKFPRVPVPWGFLSSLSYFPFIGWIDKLTGMLQRPQNNFQEIDRVYQELIDKFLDPN